jgi:hypothetical protein
LESQNIMLRANRLWVRFEKSSDRFLQSLGVGNENQMQACLQSAFIDPNAVWPADAPMQQIVLEAIGPQHATVALGVGLCGYGHWSLAAESVEGDRLRFDVACKTSKVPERLSSSYRIVADCVSSTFAVEPHRLVLCLYDLSAPRSESADSRQLTVRKVTFESTIGVIAWDTGTRTIRIEPEGPLDRAGTYRWCYTIAIAEL